MLYVLIAIAYYCIVHLIILKHHTSYGHYCTLVSLQEDERSLASISVIIRFTCRIFDHFSKNSTVTAFAVSSHVHFSR